MVCCKALLVVVLIFHSHFPVTSSATDQFSSTYFNKLYPRSPLGYVLLWLKTGGLNTETSSLLQNVDNKQIPPPPPPKKKDPVSESYPFFSTTYQSQWHKKNIKLQNYIPVQPNTLLKQYTIPFYIIFSQPCFSFQNITYNLFIIHIAFDL
jgi:hypothetical protein